LSEIKRSPQDPLSRSPYAQAQTKRYTVIVGSERQRTNRVPASKIHSSVLQLSGRDYAQMRVVTSHKLSFNSPNLRTTQHSISYDIAASIIEKALKSVKEDTVSIYDSVRMESLRQATHKNQTNHRWIELSPFNTLQTDIHSKNPQNSVFDSLRCLLDKTRY